MNAFNTLYIFPLFYERLFYLWTIFLLSLILFLSIFLLFFLLIYVCIFFQYFFALFLFFIIILLYFLHIVLLYPYIYSSRNIRRTKCILLLYCKTPKLCYWRRYIHSYKVLIWFDLSQMPFCHVCHVCVIHIYRLLKGYRTYFKFWSRGGLFFNRTQERIYCNILFTEKYEKYTCSRTYTVGNGRENDENYELFNLIIQMLSVLCCAPIFVSK